VAAGKLSQHPCLLDYVVFLQHQDEPLKGFVKMKIREELKDWFHSIENDPQKSLHLLAFRDFCLDLFEEEFGGIPQEEEIDPQFVKGFLIHP
jgi:hypothetical protein